MTERAAGLTAALARYARGAAWAGMPQSVRDETVRAAVNWLGCAIGGCRTELVDRAVRAFDGAGSVRIVGRDERLDVQGAAFVNCTASGAYVFDDTHASSIVHPTAPVASALLAIADTRRVPGRAYLEALAAGMEIECRVGGALRATGSGCGEGWFMTGIAGAIGSAAAAGKTLGLTQEQMVWALGIAACQASGLRATAGSMCSYVGSSFAARSGVTAAYLAAANFTCAEHMIEGRHGLFEVIAPAADPAQVLDGLGSRFQILDNEYKRYPCGVVIHAAIEACLTISRRRKVASDEIARIDVIVHPLALSVTGLRLPEDAIQALSSVYFWVAASLTSGTAGIGQLQQRSIEDTAIRSLQSRIFAAPSANRPIQWASVSVTLTSGEILEADTADAPPRSGMSDRELDEKFVSQATTVVGAAAARDILDAWRGLKDMEDASAILDRIRA